MDEEVAQELDRQVRPAHEAVKAVKIGAKSQVQNATSLRVCLVLLEKRFWFACVQSWLKLLVDCGLEKEVESQTRNYLKYQAE